MSVLRLSAGRLALWDIQAGFKICMRRLGVSRRHLFETVEQPVLASLPAQDYEFAEWRLARVATDYHVEFKAFFYSVPHGLIRSRSTSARRAGRSRYSTVASAFPFTSAAMAAGATAQTLSACPVHRRYAEWTPDCFRRWAASIGPQTEGLIIAILANRSHPEQGFRTCLGILRLYRDLHRERAEAISARAIEIGRFTCKSIAALLPTTKPPGPPPAPAPSSITPICVAPVTSINERQDHADPSHPPHATRSRPARYGQKLPGSRRATGSSRPGSWPMARHPDRARSDAAPEALRGPFPRGRTGP